MSGWSAQSQEKLFPERIRTEVTALMKIIASGNGINPSRVGPRSLRSGGANAMFVAGYDIDVIKRWGRWKSSRFATYLWNDDKVLAGVGRGMMLATGLLPQLQRQSIDDRNKERRLSDGRAGGKGGRGRSSDNRLFLISKKISQLCRHDSRIYRRKNGFIEMADVISHGDMRALSATREDVYRIVQGDGGNFKKRFELGKMENGKSAIRTSQGHSVNSGVTSEYLQNIGNPGVVVHGTTLENARSICRHGLERVDRLHIHLGRMIKDHRGERAEGIRNHSETGVIFDGGGCVEEGVIFFRSANDVILTEGLDGRLPARLVRKVILIRSGQVLYTRERGWYDQYSEGPPNQRNEVRRDSRRIVLTENGRSRSSHTSNERTPYVIETPESRKRLLVNEDPFGDGSKVKIELEDGEYDEEPRFGNPPSSQRGSSGDDVKLPKVEGGAIKRVKEEIEPMKKEEKEEKREKLEWKESPFTEEEERLFDAIGNDEAETRRIADAGMEFESCLGTRTSVTPTSLELDNIPESSGPDLGFSGLASPDEMDFDTAISRTVETMRTGGTLDTGTWSANSTSMVTYTAQTGDTVKQAIVISSSEASQNGEEEYVDTIPTTPKAIPVQPNPPSECSCANPVWWYSS